MPNIQEYEAKKADTGLQTNNIGMEALAQEGRRVGLFYKEVGGQVARLTDEATQAYQQHEAFDLISKGSETTATDYNNRLKAFDQMVKDPTFDAADPTIVPKALQQYQETLDAQDQNYSHNRQAMEWWLRTKDEHLQGFQQTMVGELSAHAGAQAVEKQQNTAEQRADTAFGRPELTVSLLGQQATDRMGLTGGSNVDLKMSDAVNSHGREMDTQIALGGAMGVIKQSPGDQAALDHFLDQPEVSTLIGDRRAELEQRSREEFQATSRFNNDQAKQQGDQAYAQLSDQIHTYIRAGRAVPPDMITAVSSYARQFGSTNASQAETLQTALDDSVKGTADLTYQAGDERTFEAMSKGVIAGTTTQQQIDAGLTQNHTLSVKQHEILIQQFKDQQDNKQVTDGWKQVDDWMTQNVRPRLTKSGTVFDPNNPASISVGSLGGASADPNGDAAYGEAMREAHDIYQANIKAGLTPDQAVHRMIDPGSPHNIAGARMGFWMQAKSSPNALQFFANHASVVDAVQEGGQPSATPKMNPGENPAAYLKRIGVE